MNNRKLKIITSIITLSLIVMLYVPNMVSATTVTVLYEDMEGGDIEDEWTYLTGAEEFSTTAYNGSASVRLDGNDNAFKVIANVTEVMVSGWFYLNSLNGTQFLKIQRWDGGANGAGGGWGNRVTTTVEWNDTTNFNGQMSLVTTSTGGATEYNNIDIQPPINQWFHLGIWSNGTRARVWYNGSLAMDIANATAFKANQINMGNSTPRFILDGDYLVDDVYIYNGTHVNYRAGGMKSGLDVVWFSASHGGHPIANATAEIYGGAEASAGAGANASIPNRLAKNMTCADMFWGGENTTTALLRYQTDVLDLEPDIVFLMLGPNDYPTLTSAQTIANIVNMANQALAEEIVVVIADPPPRKDAAPASWGVYINETITGIDSYADATDNVIRCETLIFFKGANWSISSSYRNTADKNHFNPTGLAFMAKFAEEAIGNASAFVAPAEVNLVDLLNEELDANIPQIISYVFIMIVMILITMLLVIILNLTSKIKGGRGGRRP